MRMGAPDRASLADLLLNPPNILHRYFTHKSHPLISHTFKTKKKVNETQFNVSIYIFLFSIRQKYKEYSRQIY